MSVKYLQCKYYTTKTNLQDSLHGLNKDKMLTLNEKKQNFARRKEKVGEEKSGARLL